METQEQLEWESRTGRLVAVAAFASAALLLFVLFYGGTIGPDQKPSQPTDLVYRLGVVVDVKAQILLLGALQATAIALLAPLLWYLYKVAKFRRPELPSAALILAFVGPLAMAIVTILGQLDFVHVAERITAELQTNPRPPSAAIDFAEKEQTAQVSAVLQAFVIAARLAIAFAFVLISLNAMRAGVLSRFMGILGIITGALFVIPIGQFGIVQLFWTAAMGLLFLNRWPQGGRGPAWETGEADPWPTARDRAEEMAAARAEAQGDRPDDDDGDEEPARAVATARRRAGSEVIEADGNGNGAPPARRQSPEHPRSKKRKRKRR